VSVTPGQTLAHYRLVEKLGEGGMGEVWVAEDTKLNRKVALKILPPGVTDNAERRARFEREAQTVAGLNHPNIVTLYSVEEDRGLHFMTMELVDGETLAERTPREGFSLGKLLEHAVPLAEAVSAAHEQGVIHRDLKPANVMVGKDGRLRVLDFGLAKLHDQPQTDGGATQLPTQSITQDGRIVGTVAYMSPEQAESKSVDARSDVFSLGIVIYEMATGQRPFQGDTTVSTLTSIMRDTPQSVTERNQTLPRHFGRIVRRCLAKEPRRRYQSAVELHNELLELKEELESGELELSSGTQAVVVTRRPRWVWPVVLLATAAAAVALVAFWQRGDAEPDAFQGMTVEALTSDGITVDAAISPDGRYIVRSLRMGVDPEQQTLRLRHLATGTEVDVIPARDVLETLGFSPDGNYVTFHDGDALYRVPVLGGAPLKIVEDLQEYYTFSPDGSRVAFVRSSGPESALIVAAVDGSEKERTLVTRTGPERLGSPAWSPDGKTIVYTVHRSFPEQSARLSSVPVIGGDERPIGSDDWFTVRHTVWLPDGSGLLALANDRSPLFGDQIRLFSYPDGASRRITNDTSHYDDISVTRDGSTIVATKYEWELGIWLASVDSPDEMRLLVPESTSAPGFVGSTFVSTDRFVYGTSDLKLWVASIDGGTPRLLTPGGVTGVNPGWIPGTDRIVFGSTASGSWAGWEMDLDGGNRKPIGEGKIVGAQPGPAGEWIYYAVVEENDAFLWRRPVGGGEPEKVHQQSVTWYQVVPDGRRVMVVEKETEGAEPRVEMLSLEDGSVTPFPDIEVDCWYWRPGTEELICQQNWGGNLWSYPVDGGEPRQLTHFEDDLTLGYALSHDGSQLAYARGRVRDDALMIRDFR